MTPDQKEVLDASVDRIAHLSALIEMLAVGVRHTPATTTISEALEAAADLANIIALDVQNIAAGVRP
jgi:hypothetical protein